MPATSAKQRALMAIAEHNPGQVQKRNRGVLKMSQGQLHDFAATKGLGPVKHDTAPPGGFAHQGSVQEGPRFRGAMRTGATITGSPNREDEAAFDHAGSTKEGVNWQGAAATGRTVPPSPVGQRDAKAFANAGTSREGYYTSNCATDAKGGDWGSDGMSARPRIRRKPSREHSGGSREGFRVHPKPSRDEQPDATSHYGANLDEAQNRVANPYSAKRPGQGSSTIDMGVKPSPAPAPPGREGRHAFKMARPEFKGDKWLKPGSGPSAPLQGRPARRTERQAFKMAGTARRGG